MKELLVEAVEKKTKEHPCFKAGCSGKNARIHVAVAPRCNISCNYCVREHDCVNESRPGVTSTLLSPEEALLRYEAAKEVVGSLTVVGIAGPGDALANWEASKKTFELIREKDPDICFCLSTNGLLLPRYVDELAALGVTHVTVTMNAVDASIAAKIYQHIVLDKVAYTGIEGAQILLDNQVEGIKRLVAHGICVKINTVLVEGINDEHAEAVSRYVAKLGAHCQNITKMIPVEGSFFENLSPVSNDKHLQVRAACAKNISQISHCHQCRADAVGKLGEDLSSLLDKAATKPHHFDSSTEISSYPYQQNIRVAVASRSEKIVDEHFGHAKQFLIYETDGRSIWFQEKRNVETYCLGPEGCGENHATLSRIIETVDDCQVVVVLRIGYTPKQELASRNITALCISGCVEEAVLAASWQSGKTNKQPGDTVHVTLSERNKPTS